MRFLKLKSSNFYFRICIFLISLKYSRCVNVDFLSNYFQENVSVINAFEMYIPTVHSMNEKCRNYSLYYLQELKNQKLWATEMFDATGKMPSGILYGSSHDLGNFDECLEVKIPYDNETFFGKYCRAKFTINPPKDTKIKHNGDYYEKNNYEEYFNESMWEKLTSYSADETKGARNELYFAFCLPSSCTHEDLHTVLQEHITKYNSRNEFNIQVDITERSCQVQEDVQLETGDILFILLIVLTVLIVVLASFYDCFAKRDNFAHIKAKGKLHQVITCFSFLKNYKKFVSCSPNVDGLDCLAGMKVYSMFLIIVLHRIMFSFGSPMVNPKYVEQLYTKFETTLLLNGPILVETFFTISGFLATFLILSQFHKSKNGVNLFWIYLHRIIRLSPTYALVLAFYCTLFIKIGSGPFWLERVGLEQERCLASWWVNLLYINNYVNTDKICMFQSWYMTCDMNFFFFAPIMAWLLWKQPKLGLIIVSCLLVVSIITVFVIVYVNDLDALFLLYIKVLKDPVSHNVFKTVYIPAHMRASSYLVGILTGYLKFRMTIDNIKIPDFIVRAGWILCAPIMISSLYSGFFFYLLSVPPFLNALYASLYHFTWSVSIAWMVIAISSGYGPWIEPILSWKPLVILARLSYTVYISHGAIQIFTAATIRSPIYASIFNVEYQSAADILLAYLLAFTITMLYESPIIGLEKILVSKEDRSKEKVKEKFDSAVEMN